MQSKRTKYINLENLVYNRVSDIRVNNKCETHHVIHDNKWYRVKTFTFIQNNQSVHHIILERLEDNQTINALKDLDCHNRKLIESLLETYPKYIIPALMLIKEISTKEQKFKTMIQILRKLYKPVFRFVNIQIFIKNRFYIYNSFFLCDIIDDVSKMNKLLNKKIELKLI